MIFRFVLIKHCHEPEIAGVSFFSAASGSAVATFIATCAYAQAPAVGTGPIHDRVQAARTNPELEKKLFILGREKSPLSAPTATATKGIAIPKKSPCWPGKTRTT